MTKYSNYIELSPNYESVVDLDAEERNPNLWQEYIVHDDMKKAIDAVCQSINWENNDKRRSFWIHGAYGTGKSYAAIVLKHLFEDRVSDIETFLSRSSLASYKKRFLKLRQKGEYLVAWKSGATDIKSGTHLMMEMEVKIKNRLKEKFGDAAYYGTSSLITAAKEAIDNKHINWNVIFDNPVYGLSDEYGDLDDFRRTVIDGNSTAINKVKRVCDDLHFSMFSNTVEKFEDWLKDIIIGNGLKDTGIIFIWDEFTGFLRDCGDDNVLQRLSEFCKRDGSPFFMCLIVHRDPTWVNELGGETYSRILHRYHELEFHITESAAYDLIGDSIIPRPGMQTQWEEIKAELLSSIKNYKHEFDNLEQGVNIYDRMSKLCPLHPMTVSMLATVAQNFGASQRTLFRFMKDKLESSQGVGFIHYIANNSPDEWDWLTADYLWDYFFTRGSDVREFNAEARKVIQHFENRRERISDESFMHVFKAALLLIAVMSGSSVSNLYSRQKNAGNKLSASRNTLYKCFRGRLEQATVDECLNALESIECLRLDKQANGDARLELPYTGNNDTFDVRLDMTKKKHTRHTLFVKGGVFSKAIETKMWDSTKATFGRMSIAACSSETNSLNSRLDELKKELHRYHYKIGLLVVSVPDASDYSAFQHKIKEISAADDTKRLVIALLKEPCTNDTLDRWHRAITHKELSAEEGKKSSSDKHDGEALASVEQWSAVATDSQIFACYGHAQFSSLYGKTDLIRRIEKDVLYAVFPAAPERIVTNNTVFKKCTDSAVLSGLTKNVTDNQIRSISDALKSIRAWDIDDLETLKCLSGNDNAVAIAELAKFMQQEFMQGAKLSLDILWSKLQHPPFGYYNTKAAGCFIGVALRSFVNGSFNWIDSNNNTHLPTAENLANMVTKMLDGKTLDNDLSSGSAIWQKYKPYAKSMFSLSDKESVSESETRKYILVKIQGIGVPFWGLKYLPADKFGGDDAKKSAVSLTELFCDFIYAVSPDQESVMSNVIELFNGRGELRKAMMATFNDKPVMYSAFKRFIFEKTPEIEDLCSKLGLNDKELHDALRAYLQDAISTWREEQVLSKLDELAKELEVIFTLNTAVGENAKTYKAIQVTLNNVFEHMKIPGTVIETLEFSWLDTLKLMRHISKISWADISDKNNIADKLQTHSKTVWEFLSQPKVLLENVLKARALDYTESELSEVYMSLKPQVYEHSIVAFNAMLDKQLENISVNRNVALLKQLWETEQGATSVREWCNNFFVPIEWVLSDESLRTIQTIKTIQDGNFPEKNALQNAVTFLQNNTLSVLKDAKYVTDRFFDHIGDNYRDAFATDRDVLLDRLKTNAKLTPDVYSWATKIPDIRNVLDAYLQKTYHAKAKNRVISMPDDELRKAVLRLLDNNPELYGNFLK